VVRRPLRAAVVSVLLASLALSSCARPEQPPAPAESAKPAEPTGRLPGLDRFYAQKPAWGPCAPFALNGDQRRDYARPGLDCARLEVPLDYTKPTGRIAKVALLRRATIPQKKTGSLVVNPGGPGESGMDLAATITKSLANGPFDLVGFDPRGVGASTPAIDCDSDADIDAARADPDGDPSPAGVTHDENKARKRAQRCIDRSGGLDVLENSGTRDVARDLDVLRAALGDPKLTYLGFSYGTRIGETYAEQFPSFVRAMILDGAIDPDQSDTDRDVTGMAAFQHSFQTYAGACASRPGCPLGSDPAKVVTVFQSLVRPLIAHPAKVKGSTVKGGTRVLSYPDAITATDSAMYDPEQWDDLTKGLTALRSGDGTAMLDMADDSYGRDPRGHYPNDDEALLVVNCVDGDRITDRAVVADENRRIDQVAPYADDGRGPSGSLDTCAFLPVTPTSIQHTPSAEGLPPILVVSTTGDPATPYQAGVDLASALHGKLLTVVGNQHTAIDQGNLCTDRVAGGYLVQPTAPLRAERCVMGAPPDAGATPGSAAPKAPPDPTRPN
jgi:pimeloyl-ACP methyl ester carboxylesterase